MKTLNKIISNIGNEHKFTFVSVGANDGIFVDEVFQSNLLSINWECYFIEPVGATFYSLIENYKKHFPNNKFVYENYAIHIDEGEDFLVTNKVDDSMGMCSFFRKENEDTVKIKIHKKRFESFLQKNNITHINFLKTDCEGMDYEIILQCFDNNIFPEIILYEDISLGNDILGVRGLTDLIDWVNNHSDYLILKDISEFQYEEHNKLLINKKLLKYV